MRLVNQKKGRENPQQPSFNSSPRLSRRLVHCDLPENGIHDGRKQLANQRPPNDPGGMGGASDRETTEQARAMPDGQPAPRTGGRNEPDGGSRIVPQRRAAWRDHAPL